MAKDSKKDTKSKSSSKDAKSKPAPAKAATPSKNRPSGSTTPSASGQRSGSTRPSGSTPSTGVQRTNSGRQIGATPSTGVQRTNSGRQIGATPSTGVQRTNSGRQIGATPSTGVQRTNSGRQIGATKPSTAAKPPASTAAPAAGANPSASRSAAPAATRAAPAAAAQPASTAGAGAGSGAGAAAPPSGYGAQSMGAGNSLYGANSMYGAGSQQPNSMYGMAGQQPNSMYGMTGQQPGGSMYGAGAGSAYGVNPGGSMYGMGADSAYGTNQGGSMFGMNPNGSMYGGSQNGSMYGMNTGYGSMGAGGMGSQMGGSMYGMNPMMGSMYGMGGPMMGSMYGMGGPMGSMYGMNPMMGGSMYGMNPMMGSMYGMGGPMGSMYGMGSFASYGGGSMYGSLGGGMGSLYYADVGETKAGPVGGFFSSCRGPMSNESDRLPVSGIKLQEDNRRLVRSTKKADEKERGITGKSGDDKEDKDDKKDDKKDDDKDKKSESKSRSAPAPAEKDAPAAAKADADSGKDRAASKAAAEEKADGSKSRSLAVPSTTATKEDDNTTQTVVLIEANADPSVVKVDGTTVTLKGAPAYTAMEVIKAEQLDVVKSKSFADMVEHVAQGHNVSAVFFSTKEKQLDVIKRAALETTKSVTAKLADDKDVKHLKITTMAAATSSPQKGKDLLDGNAEKELQFASNPIFGSCVYNLKKAVSSDAQGAEKVMKTVLEQKVAPTDLVIVQHIIQHSKAGVVYMSSLTLVFARDPAVAEAVSICDERTIPMHWLKTTLGGTSRLTVVVGLTGDKKSTDEEAGYLKAGATMGNNKNQAPRSGNVSRFIEYTEAQLKKREDSVAKASTPEEKASVKQLMDKMRGMVKDAKELTDKPESEPKMYLISKHRDASDDAKPKSRNLEIGAVEPNSDPFTSIHRMAIVEGAPAASNGNTVEVTVAGAKKAFDVDECIFVPTADKEPGASKEITRLGGIFASGCNVSLLGAECVPGAKPVDYKTWYFFGKLLKDMLEKSDAARQNEFQLYMSVVREREVVADLLAADPASSKGPLVVAASPLFGPHVHNTSMKKLTKPADVQAVLQEALKKAEPFVGEDNAMIVATAALKQIVPGDVIVASLFAVSAKDMRPFEGVVDRDSKFSRSLFSYALGGPCSTELLVTLNTNEKVDVSPVLTAQRKVSHTKAAVPRCGSVKEFLKYTKNNKDRMAKKVEEAKDSTERTRAKNGLKRMEESEKDHEALLKDPAHVDLKSYAAEDASGAKPSAGDKPAASPGAQQRAAPAAAKAPTPSAQAPPTASPSKARAAPTTPAANASPKLESKESDTKRTPVEFVAVITEEIRQGLETKPGWSVVGSDGKLTVTDVDGPHEFTADEIITRPTRSVSINSTTLDRLRDRFLSGYNVALLTADTRGSAASLEMVDRTVRHVLGKADPASELFISLCAYKERDGEVCDTMKEGATFEPMNVSSSPLFGPSVTGATYEKVGTAKDFVRVMDKGLRTCGESRACVLVHLVLSTPKPAENDVIVSSFLAVMCPGDISLYRKALAASSKDRGILQFAVGGPCHTVFAAGFTKNPVDEGCLALPNLANALRETSNGRCPGGSVQRFIQHTRAALKQLQETLDNASTEDEKSRISTYEKSVSAMLKDAESYIADPAGHLPAVYKK